MLTSFYQTKLHDWSGKVINFEQFHGKPVLVVNTASECGFTPQYQMLQELYDHYDNLEILACPCNDFGGQEPGKPEDIAQFCQRNYGVTFQVSEKISIVNDCHELFSWLSKRNENGTIDFEIDWNFCKFLVNKKGQLIGAWKSAVEPFDEEIIEKIEEN